MHGMNDTLYFHALSLISGIGSEKLRKLSKHFDSGEAAWNAGESELRAAGIPEKLASAIISQQKNISLREEEEKLAKWNIHLAQFGSPQYPSLLAEIPNPPFILYRRGNTDWFEKPIITVVGTRRPTHYGISVAREFGKRLAEAGIVVASGMALGIDKEAHHGALEGHGDTISVLGNGLDDPSIAPRTHLNLAHTISMHGALLSDYPPGTPASEHTFPARNRIMAGLSLGTLVVEATEKSGTLITAQLALDYNREVFAVPGSVYSDRSRGAHTLIRNGAIITESIEDILTALPIESQRNTVPSSNENIITELSLDEQKILRILGNDTLHVDKLVTLSTLETSSTLSTLSMLEMKGFIRNIGNMHYVRIYRT